MPRHGVKYLAVSALVGASLLAAVSASAEEPGDFDSQRMAQEFVASQGQPLPVPSRDLSGSKRLLYVTETFHIVNGTGSTLYKNGTALSGHVLVQQPATIGGEGFAQTEVPPAMNWSQGFSYTTNPADPWGAAKACVFSVFVTYSGGVCSASVVTYPKGNQGVVCTYSPPSSGIDPVTCELELTLGID
ncbi:hypothetical protein D7Y15_24515 [Corallococcus sp. AB030]|uniref:hypothetical protein n=1 Tax=Corallococcus sp. AB030 TaxID=2316716 RepID=UPI000EBFC65C|nr:hypothetical protein [Corallococcus sp. AB030]RKI09084.1 hypothetical protein D7Y15_24515 [Corallococcus sp. AB030]